MLSKDTVGLGYPKIAAKNCAYVCRQTAESDRAAVVKNQVKDAVVALARALQAAGKAPADWDTLVVVLRHVRAP